MSKVNTQQTDFAAGEFSPKLYGRVDLQKYAHGAELVRNFLIMPQGGAARRTGTRFVSEVADSTQLTRLIEFRFSTKDAAVIELGNNTIRFYEDQGLVQSGGSPYSISSPYGSADLSLIKYTQSASIIYLFHPNYPPQQLARYGQTNWVLSALVFTDGPYLPFNYSNPTTPNPSVTITISGLASGGANPGDTGVATASSAIFNYADVGRCMRIYGTGTGGPDSSCTWQTITSVISATAVNFTMGAVGSQTFINLYNGTYNLWRLGAITALTGYPSVGTFFQQRFVMANTAGQPQTMWLSNSSDFFNFGDTLFDTAVVDSNAIYYTIASNQVNTILWLSPAAVLLIGTDGAEWELSSNNYNATPVTPTTINVTIQTSNGSQATSRPKKVGWETVFLARSLKDVYKLLYQFQVNGYQSISLSLLGEHILRENGGAFDMAYQQFPYSILWFPLNNGLLAGLTYVPEQDLIAWHLHTIGGTYSGGNAVVESVAVIPTPDGSKDQVWLIVKRTIGGGTKRYVEYMEVPYEASDTAQPLSCFLDCASTYNSTPTTEVTGASYLADETVGILADGGVLADTQITSEGNLFLPSSHSIITFGYHYQSILKTLRLDGGGSSGSSQAKLGKINRLGIRFRESVGCQYSTDGVVYNDVEFRDVSDLMGQPVPLYTGDKRVHIDAPVDIARQYWIRQVAPYPLTVLAVFPEAMVNQ